VPYTSGMGFFGFGSTPNQERILLLHAESGSVGGAYVSLQNDGADIWYTNRVAVEQYNSESPAAAFERSIRVLCDKLVKEGAPALARGAGSAHIARLVIYIGAPWEETRLRKEVVDLGREFTVSHATQARALAHETEHAQGRRHLEETVVATFLNGYETQNPIGKRTHRAEFVIRSSSLDEAASKAAELAVRSALHTAPALSAFAPAVSHAIGALYPHDDCYGIIIAENETTTLALIDGSRLADVRAVPVGVRELGHSSKTDGIHSTNDGTHAALDLSKAKPLGAKKAKALETWREAVTKGLTDALGERVIPQTLFLIATEDIRATLKAALDEQTFQTALHANGALRIVPLTPQLITGVRMRTDSEADLNLMLLARAEAAR
jgi:hypothetical protein